MKNFVSTKNPTLFLLLFVCVYSSTAQYNNCSLFSKITQADAFVYYSIDPNLPTAWQDAIRRAASTWTNLHQASYGFSLYENSSSSNEIYSADLGSGPPLIGATTYPSWTDICVNGDIKLFDYVLTAINTNSAITWYTGVSSSVPSGQVDLESVMLHEFGHWIDLLDSSDPNSTMGNISTGQAKRTITVDCDDCVDKIYGDYISSSTTYTSAIDQSLSFAGNITFNRDYTVNNPPSLVVGGAGSGIILRTLSGSSVTWNTNTRMELYVPSYLILNQGTSCNLSASGAEVIPDVDIFNNKYSCVVDFAGCGIGGNGISGGCIRVKGGLRLGKGKTLSMSNGGLIWVNETGIVTVDSGAVILIDSTAKNIKLDPGATFKFGKDAKLNCFDSLIAKGSATKPITFTSSASNPTGNNWTGIYLKGGPDTLQYCKIKYANWGVNAFTNKIHFLNYCTIDSCVNYGA